MPALYNILVECYREKTFPFTGVAKSQPLTLENNIFLLRPHGFVGYHALPTAPTVDVTTIDICGWILVGCNVKYTEPTELAASVDY